MQILFRPLGGKPDLAPWLERETWEATRPREERLVRENAYTGIVGREPPGDPMQAGLHRALAEVVFSYRAFPESLVTPNLLRTPLEAGDTVGTQYHLFPGIDLFFASRVLETFDAPQDGIWRTGFTYTTLVGHPVMGSETFSVEKNLTTGEITVALRSWSQPITRLARCFAIPCRILQARAGRAAVERLRKLAEEFRCSTDDASTIPQSA